MSCRFNASADYILAQLGTTNLSVSVQEFPLSEYIEIAPSHIFLLEMNKTLIENTDCIFPPLSSYSFRYGDDRTFRNRERHE